MSARLSWPGWLLSNPFCSRQIQLVTPLGFLTVTSAQPSHQQPHLPLSFFPPSGTALSSFTSGTASSLGDLLARLLCSDWCLFFLPSCSCPAPG